MISRFLWHASRCDERLHVLLATRRASWNGRQKPEATLLAAFGTPSCSLIKLFTRLGEISVCSLWMHIRRLWMAIRRLWMAIRSLQTEISIGFEDDFCMLLGWIQVHIQKGQRAVSGMTQPPGICLFAVSESDQILLADALIIEDAADGVGYEVSDTELLHLGTSVVVGDAISEYQLLQCAVLHALAGRAAHHTVAGDGTNGTCAL